MVYKCVIPLIVLLKKNGEISPLWKRERRLTQIVMYTSAVFITKIIQCTKILAFSLNLPIKVLQDKSIESFRAILQFVRQVSIFPATSLCLKFNTVNNTKFLKTFRYFIKRSFTIIVNIGLV